MALVTAEMCLTETEGAVSLEIRENASSVSMVSKQGHTWTRVLCCCGPGLWT